MWRKKHFKAVIQAWSMLFIDSYSTHILERCSYVVGHMNVKFQQNSWYPKRSLILTYVMNEYLYDILLAGDTFQFTCIRHYMLFKFVTTTFGKIIFSAVEQFFKLN